MIKRPTSQEAYRQMVKDALIEVDELRMSIEYDEDFMSGASAFVQELETELKALYKAMEDGSYAFADEDLGFMTIVAKADHTLLPFKDILRRINETHRKGLDSEAT